MRHQVNQLVFSGQTIRHPAELLSGCRFTQFQVIRWRVRADSRDYQRENQWRKCEHVDPNEDIEILWRRKKKIMALGYVHVVSKKKNEERGTTSEETNCGDHVETRFL